MGFGVSCLKWAAATLIITLTWIPVIIWRHLISILLPIFNHNVISIVPACDSMFASLASHPKPNMAIILTTVLKPAEGLNLSILRNKFAYILQKPKYSRLA